ncbi:MAG: hypothetical protein M1817_003607 [Caeruleum heppii]|nr:MAG: hypothetical protein M1817_003607 [Caeruleum heppii]
MSLSNDRDHIDSSKNNLVAPVTPVRTGPPRPAEKATPISLLPPPFADNESDMTLTPATSHCPSYPSDTGNASPASAFYCHPTTHHSSEVFQSESKPIIPVQDSDLEKGVSRTSKQGCSRTKNCRHPVWPGRHSRLKGAEVPGCTKRNWDPMRYMDKRLKFALKILIAMFIVSAAVGIGIGISKAVGAPVWKHDGYAHIGQRR